MYFCLIFLCTAFLRSKALTFSAWPFPSQTPISLPLSCPIYVPTYLFWWRFLFWNHYVGLTRKACKSSRFLWSSKLQPMRFLGHEGYWDLQHMKGENQIAEARHPRKLGDEKWSSLDALAELRDGDIYCRTCHLGLFHSFPPFCLTLRVTTALHILPTFYTKPSPNTV